MLFELRLTGEHELDTSYRSLEIPRNFLPSSYGEYMHLFDLFDRSDLYVKRFC